MKYLVELSFRDRQQAHLCAVPLAFPALCIACKEAKTYDNRPSYSFTAEGRFVLELQLALIKCHISKLEPRVGVYSATFVNEQEKTVIVFEPARRRFKMHESIFRRAYMHMPWPRNREQITRMLSTLIHTQGLHTEQIDRIFYT